MMGSPAAPMAAPPACPEVARLFADLRRALGATPEQLAHRAGTRAEVILALEAGHIAGLPPWPDTVRIVETLLVPLAIDPNPVLGLIAARGGAAPMPVPAPTHRAPAVAPNASVYSAPSPQARAAAAVAHRAPAPRPVPAAAAKPAQPAARLHGLGAAARGAARRLRGMASRVPAPRIAKVAARLPAVGPRLRRGALVAAVAVAALGLIMQTGIAATAASALPAPLAGAYGYLRNAMTVAFAPVREGLRWIEVEDPRTRRADKLPTRGQ